MHVTWILLAALSAQELLTRSIAYHDPAGAWDAGAFRIELHETRPGGTVRNSRILIDNGAGRFELERRYDDGATTSLVVSDQSVTAKLNGSGEFDEDQASKYRLGAEQAVGTRNYYAYLYGLPMKLRDPGTLLDDEAKETTFQGRNAYELRVTYDEDVGSDTWYFYLDRSTYALIGYRFYHDESKNDGEYITLEEEASGAGLKLPRIRKWYRHQNEEFLGTDTIETLKKP